MIEAMRSRLSFANVVSSIALFAALGLGTAWALEADSVKSRHIVDNQVKSADVRDDTLNGGGLQAVDLAASSVGDAEVADGSMTTFDIDESTLFNDNSLNNADIDQATLGLAAGESQSGFESIAAGVTSEPLFLANGPYNVRYACPDPVADPATIRFRNQTSETMRLFHDTGATDPTYFELGTGTLSTSASVNPAGDEHRFSFRITEPTERYGIVTVNSAHLGGDTCYLQVQAWLSP